ncbi:hypothetical protein ACJ51O_19590 [Burkholderia pyrrocinia]|uniref:hypothetical protein n=1 Tax=Burkholderia pyrrocinia TaxID=60550 RepID=UPI0038B5016D
MVFLRDGGAPGAARALTVTHARKVPARASREMDERDERNRYAPRAVQAFKRIDEAVAGSGRRDIAGQEGATRVTRRRAVGTWLP